MWSFLLFSLVLVLTIRNFCIFVLVVKFIITTLKNIFSSLFLIFPTNLLSNDKISIFPYSSPSLPSF